MELERWITLIGLLSIFGVGKITFMTFALKMTERIQTLRATEVFFCELVNFLIGHWGFPHVHQKSIRFVEVLLFLNRVDIIYVRIMRVVGVRIKFDI